MKRWILAQQLGFAACRLRLSAHLPHLRSAGNALAALLSAYGSPKIDVLATLPPATLRLLLKAADWDEEPFGDYLKPLTAAANFLLAQGASDSSLSVDDRLRSAETITDPFDENHPSPLPRLRALAHVIMHGNAEAYWICRLARYLFPGQASSSWRSGIKRSWDYVLTRRSMDFNNVLEQLRNPSLQSNERLEKTKELVAIIDGVPWCEQIENILFHHIFGWPLFFIDSASAGTAFALPVMVDILIPEWVQGKPTRRAPSIEGIDALNLEAKDVEDPRRLTFAAYLRIASWAAVRLWRGTHNTGGQFRHEVARSSARFDFRIASDIVRDFARANCPDGRLSIHGGSASAYFSQLVLSRLLGRGSFIGSLVTGVIGNQRKREDGSRSLDYEFWAPGERSIQEKLKHAFDTQYSPRTILPTGDEVQRQIKNLLAPTARRTADDNNFRQTSQVITVQSLSRVADAVQESPWRKKVYVRCPEVEWAAHCSQAIARESVLPPTHRDVSSVLARLRHCDDTVVELCNVGPRAVVSALLHIDNEVRLAARFPKPSLFWQFIRVANEDGVLGEDTEFWHILWRLCGAPSTDFELFSLCPSRKAALERLVNTLSKFEPDRECPARRAPDLIVLIGTAAIRKARQEWNQPLSRPLEPDAIFEDLRARNDLPISPDRRGCQHLNEALGRTRFILLPDAVRDELPALAGPAPSERQLECLRALATYQWGFTHSLAGMLLRQLGVSGHAIHALLKQLRDKDLIREFSGEFHLPHDLRKQILENERNVTPRVLADRHRAAGFAIAPYASPAEVPALAYEDAFQPALVREALHHFKRASQLYWEAMSHVDQEEKASCYVRRTGIQTAIRALTRAAMLPGWAMVHRFVKGDTCDTAEDAFWLAGRLIQAHWEHPDNPRRNPGDARGTIPPHPVRLRDAARAAEQTHSVKVEEIIDLYDQVGAASKYYADSANFDVPEALHLNELWTLPYFANYLAERREPILRVKVNEFDERILQLKPNWSQLPGEWLERRGDEAQTVEEAARLYAEGMQYAPAWHVLAFKALGASRVARVELVEVTTWLKCMDNDDEAAERAEQGSRKAFMRDKRDVKHPSRSVRESYWRAVGGFLGRRWGERRPAYAEFARLTQLAWKTAPSGDDSKPGPETGTPVLEGVRVRLNRVAGTPLLETTTYSNLFRVILSEVTARTFVLNETSKAVRDECVRLDSPVGRRDVNFVLNGLRCVGCALDNPTSISSHQDLAAKFFASVLVRCEQLDISLSDSDKVELRHWILGESEPVVA